MVITVTLVNFHNNPLKLDLFDTPLCSLRDTENQGDLP